MLVLSVLSGFFLLYRSICAEEDVVSFYSVIKLKNDHYDVRLHSHDIKYGTGSSQQSVTGVTDSDDVNSHWQILPAMNVSKVRGDVVNCDDVIRLKHLLTDCFLHSHLFSSPLSRGNQEISCFGKGDRGDNGDHWIVVCGTSEWQRGISLKLRHQDTGKYLATSGQKYSRPISGHYEIVAISSAGSSAGWKAVEGVYMTQSKFHQFRYDEL